MRRSLDQHSQDQQTYFNSKQPFPKCPQTSDNMYGGTEREATTPKAASKHPNERDIYDPLRASNIPLFFGTPTVRSRSPPSFPLLPFVPKLVLSSVHLLQQCCPHPLLINTASQPSSVRSVLIWSRPHISADVCDNIFRGWDTCIGGD